MMTFGLSSLFVVFGLFFGDEILFAFGANGAITAPAKEFFFPILIAVPFQALSMMGNSVIRAEDKTKHSMISMIISAASNIILDILFIKNIGNGCVWGCIGYCIILLLCFAYILWFFIYRSELRLKWGHFAWHNTIAGEITSMSFVTFARQGVISVLAVILNHTLFAQGRRARCNGLWHHQPYAHVCTIPCIRHNTGLFTNSGYNMALKTMRGYANRFHCL
jgi:Na+-driven multidrug efflux pump